jgi:hypothetical protein
MTTRMDDALRATGHLPPCRPDPIRARAVLGPAAAPAIARRLDAVMPAGSDFASALRTQLELARRSGRAA